jgi:hypothetical protein
MSELSPPREQQPKESARAYGAFCTYRDLGPCRSLKAAAEAFYRTSAEPSAKSRRRPKGTARHFEKWSAAFHWVERVAAWDRHLDAEARQAQEKACREMAQRHAKEAQGLQAKALERLRSLRPEELGPVDVLRFFVEAAKLERLALGQPDCYQLQELTGPAGGPVVLNIVEEVVTRAPTASARTANRPPAPGPAGLPQK